ncbi:MAG TPA: PepSY domain-containing protein [Blastocatellia bacterium]|nr:PepSY domain-containing protein [Blastocatellia bacterium]
MTTSSLSSSARAKTLIVAFALFLLAVPFAIGRPQQGSEQEARKKAEKEQVQSEKEMMERSLTPEQLAERRANMQEEIKARTKYQLQLAQIAKISMEQAIQIASAQQPGAVIQCSLIHERGTAFYRVNIVSGDENNPVSTNVFVNAVDGTIGSFPNAGYAVTFTDGNGNPGSYLMVRKP